MSEKRFNVPAVDIYEGKDHYYLVLDMPGTSRENIEITTEGDTLTVTGKVMETEKEWKPVVTEFNLNDYKREFSIGSKIVRENISARYDNGILTVTLEKSEMAKPRKIEVRAA